MECTEVRHDDVTLVNPQSQAARYRQESNHRMEEEGKQR